MAHLPPPDLLEALVGLLPIAGYEHMSDDDLREETRLGNGATAPILNARLAIAKATGTQ